jgi:hypothetical protein
MIKIRHCILKYFKSSVLIFILSFLCLCSFKTNTAKPALYLVARLKKPMKTDANWNKPQWKNCDVINISNFMETVPKHHPVVQAKMMYDDASLCLIFKVKQKYVRCVNDSINGPVWEDDCVEFFFAPNTSSPEKYFNLEINCAGTALMHFNTAANTDIRNVDKDDIKKIEIAHSLPGVFKNEIKGPVSWTLEYKIPLAMLTKYIGITPPAASAEWRANFYKIAHKSSNRHYMTWAYINKKEVDFHTPEYFGVLKFQ